MERNKLFTGASSIIFFTLMMVMGCAKNDRISSLGFSGTLEMTEYSVGAPVAGRIAEVLVEEEQPVTKGQVMATLEHFAQAKKDFERAAELAASGGLSQQEYEHARQAMEDQEILSPIDGVVLIKVREPGEVLAAGAPVVVIGNPQDMWTRIFIPENLISQVSVGQKARVRVDGLDGEINGVVGFIATKAEFTPRNIQTPEERATQTFSVKVLLQNPPVSLHPGVAADVYFD